LKAGDEILVSAEHHSNIVPWQMLAERTGAVLRVIQWMKMGSWSCQPTINYF
jgi:cysteine desulfurase/selenocysteine lyase